MRVKFICLDADGRQFECYALGASDDDFLKKYLNHTTDHVKEKKNAELQSVHIDFFKDVPTKFLEG
ncbi:MAG: hypothetical protein QM496_05710 [Verrucomicrobiota bacterium]